MQNLKRNCKSWSIPDYRWRWWNTVWRRLL